MKSFLLATALVCAASTSFAGGLAEPVMEPEVVTEKASSSGGILIPLLLLILVAAAVSGGGDGGSTQVLN